MQFSDHALGLFLRQTTGNTVWKSVADQGRLACATYSVACCAVLQALGPDWCQTHIGRTDKASDYFKANYHQARYVRRSHRRRAAGTRKFTKRLEWVLMMR